MRTGEYARGASGSGSSEEDAVKLAEIAADNVLLEVIAYPAGQFSAPAEDGERAPGAKRLRGEGRRRVVLTAEGLRQRRRLLHPSAASSFERPPLGGTKSWSLRHHRDTGDIGGTCQGEWIQKGGQRGYGEGEAGLEKAKSGVRNAGRDGEIATEGQGTVDSGGQGGDTCEGGGGEEVGNSPRQALDDLVDMLAIGPSADDEEQAQGAPLPLFPLVLGAMGDDPSVIASGRVHNSGSCCGKVSRLPSSQPLPMSLCGSR